MTRNAQSPAAQALATADASLVVADLYDCASLEHAVAGAHFIFAVTNFHDPNIRNEEKEKQQGVSVANATVKAAADTSECFLWSSLPDPRRLPTSFHSMDHWYSKAAVADYLRGLDLLRGRFTEVWVSAYY